MKTPGESGAASSAPAAPVRLEKNVPVPVGTVREPAGHRTKLAKMSCFYSPYGPRSDLCLGHISTGPRTIFPTRRLPWILETVRVPYDFNFYGVCGHIFYGARAVSGENWWSVIARRRQQTVRVPAGCRAVSFRAPSEEQVHRTAPGRPAGSQAGVLTAPGRHLV